MKVKKKKQFNISFEENGSEYTGSLEVSCNKIEKIGENTFKADGVIVTIDEKIISIEENKK